MADTLEGVDPALAGYWAQIVKWLAVNRPTVTPSITSAHRTIAEQEATRAQNGCGGARVYDRSCKGNPTTAVPSERAPHVRGVALDVADGTGDRRHIMAAIAALKLPLNRPVAGESWHIQLLESAVTGGRAPGNPGVGELVDTAGSAITDPHMWYRFFLSTAGLVMIAAGIAAVGWDLSGLRASTIVKAVA